MPKVTFNGSDKLIIINSGITSINVKIDLYSDWKEWLLQSDNVKYPQAFTAVGGDPISDTLSLGTTYFLENSWKIRPYEGNHRLVVTGNLYARDGSNPFTSTTGNYNVMINLSTSNLVDLVTVETGGNTLSDIGQAVWTYNKTSNSISADTMGDVVKNTESLSNDNQALILAGL